MSTGGGDGGGTMGSFGTDMGSSSLRKRGKSSRVPLTLDSFDTICCDMPKTKTNSKEGDDPHRPTSSRHPLFA